ncbi:MAG: methyltransferase [Fimbriimonas sp.]
MKEGYVLARGDAGAHRLAVLNAAMWPSSRALLRRAGLRRGGTFLDVGCGAGDLTRRVAALGVEAVGVDVDPAFIARAQARPSGARFEVRNVTELDAIGRSFDVVYARYLLSHLTEPVAALRAMMKVTRPGGPVVVEDIDFDLHVAEPRPAAFDRYLDLYRAVVLHRGGDPILGRRLYRLAADAGLRDVQVRVHVQIPTQGEARHITTLTLAGIRDAVVREGMATESEVDSLGEELRALEETPSALVSVAGTYGVWGRV